MAEYLMNFVWLKHRTEKRSDRTFDGSAEVGRMKANSVSMLVTSRPENSNVAEVAQKEE
tara:strand:+ start:89 stop:265 length:177 start_codon:yes stop_codon:yes gene_type:complete